MGSSVLTSRGSFGTFADWLLADEFPGLPNEYRAQVVDFACRRARQTPTPLQLGVTALSILVGVLARARGQSNAGQLVRRSSLPFVGELPRMVRSLGVAYIWERWPGTLPDGSQPGPTHAGAASA